MAVVVVAATACAVSVMAVAPPPIAGAGSGAGGFAEQGGRDGGLGPVVRLAATAFYAFEGIGLVLPVANAMAQPADYAAALRRASAVLALCYVSIGASCGEAFRERGLSSGSVTAFLAERVPGLLQPPAPPTDGSGGTGGTDGTGGTGGGWLGPALHALNLLVTVAVASTFALQLLPAAQVLSTWRCSQQQGGRRSLLGSGGGSSRETVLSSTEAVRLVNPASRQSGGGSGGGGADARDPDDSDDDSTTESDDSGDSDHDATSARGAICGAARLQRLLLVCMCIAVTLAVPSVGLLVTLFGAVGASLSSRTNSRESGRDCMRSAAFRTLSLSPALVRLWRVCGC